MALFIGLISGTSVDAIDAVLCEIDIDVETPSIKLLESLSYPYPEKLQQELLAFGKLEYLDDPIDQLGRLDQEVANSFSEASLKLLSAAGVKPHEVTAIGSHGQTVRHRPELKSPFTLQIGDPNVIATRTGITTIADFRRRDMANSGQGAPFAPAFHHAFFSSETIDRAVVNLGGIANVTILKQGQSPIGFDTGPANTLMDQWIQKDQGISFDHNGQWALSGRVSEPLLELLLKEPYFAESPPKSTGCEYFNLDWLSAMASQKQINQLSANDIQRTLLELTAITVADAISNHLNTGEVYVCGGGAHNMVLMDLMQSKLPPLSVRSTDNLGISPDWVEAMTFAWFGSKTINQEPIPIASVTGATTNSILGGVYFK